MRRTVLASLLLAASGASAAVDLESLARNSPFGGGTAGSTVSAGDTGGLELRGMYVDQGKTYLSIYNATTKQSTWVVQGDLPSKATADLAVRAFDRDSGVATVDAGSRSVQLQLKQASVAKYEAPREEPAAAATPGGPAGGPQPGPDGKIQTPWGNFTPEQIAAFRAEREKRWAERMSQAQQEGRIGGEPGKEEAGRPSRGGDRGGDRGGERGGSRGGRGG